MRNYNKLKAQVNTAIDGAKQEASNLKIVADDARRVSDVARDVNIIIKDLDRQFEQATKLTGIDIKFLFVATALQCLRQYLLTQFPERKDDKDASKAANDWEKENVQSNYGKIGEPIDMPYRPTLSEIAHNKVPYDTISGTKTLNVGGGLDGELKGLSGHNHRFLTPGHDPLFGWIFGTANIATRTLTRWSMIDSWFVRSGAVVAYPQASTAEIFINVFQRLLQEPQAIALSVVRQGVHIWSDVHSYKGIPIPAVSAVAPKTTERLADVGEELGVKSMGGVDFGNMMAIGNQMMFAILINSMVAMVHGLFYDESIHGEHRLYEVKTRKILSYSNAIASASNVLQVVLRSVALQDSKAMHSLDIGGLIVTIYRLITDYNFIKEVKLEFLEKEFYNIVMGDNYNF